MHKDLMASAAFAHNNYLRLNLSWVLEFLFRQSQGYIEFRTMSEEKSSKEEEADALISSDAVLPDELLEKILSVLPMASILNSTLVSKRWHAVVQRPWSVIPPPQEAWLFMSTQDMNPMHGRVYNPNLRRWFTFGFPFIGNCFRSVASSGGLVTVLHKTGHSKHELFVYNPITKEQTRLPRGPRLSFMFRSEVAMSVDLQTKSYTVAVVNYKYTRRVLSVHVYESKTRAWLAVLKQPVAPTYYPHKIVICSGILYCLYHNFFSDKFCLLRLRDLMARTQPMSLLPTEVAMPSKVVYPWVINLREKLVMVGGIEKKSRRNFSGIEMMKGLRIWVLAETGWKEVARMPQERIQQRIGDYYFDCFYCCGAGDFIFVQCSVSPVMLIFDMVQLQWQWSNFPFQRSRAMAQPSDTFCFQPNLKINC